jgi:ABC-2 type transport system ATP-binding protein
MITVTKLTKVYRKYKTGESLWDLTKSFVFRRYERSTAVDGVSFDIEPGTCVGLLGANGAGKTTLVKMLAGLLVPTQGDAKVLGFRPWYRDYDYLRQIGVVMGSRQQLWIDVSARENLKLNQVVYKIEDTEFKRRLKKLSALLDVEKLLDVQIRKLSLGEKMKMELISALLHQPKLLFLDEPTIGLDVVAQAKIREFIKEQVKEEGTTVLLTSHYIKDLEELCPRVLLLQHGRILHDGALSALAGDLAKTKRIIWSSSSKETEEVMKQWNPKSLGAGRFYVEADPKEVATVVRALVNTAGIDELSVETQPLEDSVREAMAE